MATKNTIGLKYTADQYLNMLNELHEQQVNFPMDEDLYLQISDVLSSLRWEATDQECANTAS